MSTNILFAGITAAMIMTFIAMVMLGIPIGTPIKITVDVQNDMEGVNFNDHRTVGQTFKEPISIVNDVKFYQIGGREYMITAVLYQDGNELARTATRGRRNSWIIFNFGGVKVEPNKEIWIKLIGETGENCAVAKTPKDAYKGGYATLEIQSTSATNPLKYKTSGDLIFELNGG